MHAARCLRDEHGGVVNARFDRECDAFEVELGMVLARIREATVAA